MRPSRCLATGLLAFMLGVTAPSVGAERVTSHPDLDYFPAPSGDGRFLAFVSEREGNADIWLKSMKIGRVSIPRRLTSHPAIDRSPALNTDGTQLLYVSHKSDPKGDVYIMDVLTGRESRLTDLVTRDSAPAWGLDGASVYYLKQHKVNERSALYRRDLQGGNEQRVVEGVASFSIGPNSWVIYSDGLHLKTFRESEPAVEVQMTNSKAVDLWPSFRGGESIYFVRYEEDTNGDGLVSTDDESSIWMGRWDLSSGEQRSLYQLTPAGQFHVYPADAGRYVYYSDLERGNLFRIHALEFLQDYSDLAQATDVAWVRMDQGYTNQGLLMLANLSRNQVARLAYPKRAEFDLTYAEALREARRFRAAEAVIEPYVDAGGPLSARAKIYTISFDVHGKADTLSLAALERAVRRSVKQVLEIGASHRENDRVKGVALIEAGNLHLLANDSLTALNYFVQADRLQDEDTRAKALFSRGKVYRQLGDEKSLLQVFVNVIRSFGEETFWGRRAVAQAVAVSEAEGGFREQVASLNRVAKGYPDLPLLSASAIARIAELYDEHGEQIKAVETLDHLVRDFPSQTTLVEQSYRRKAEILVAAEQYERAATTYEELVKVTGSHSEDLGQVRRLLVLQLVRSALKTRGLGEVRIAAKKLRAILEEHGDSVEAHRGYIETKVMLGETSDVQAFYQKLFDNNPDNAVYLYTLGLALSYSEPPDLPRVTDLVEQAADRQPGISYYHQTLGWAYEQRERISGESGYLERAEREYRIALELNDRFEFPHVEANLLLNLGNTYIALQNYTEAYRHYRLREELNPAAREDVAELLYQKQFGEACFKTGRSEESIPHYKRALALVPTDQPALKAELLERIALSYQDLGRHAEAVDYFSQSLSVNLESGRTENLALLRRNIGVNLYNMGLTGSGANRASLKRALESYFSSLETLREFGVTEKAEGSGLFQVEVALGDQGSKAAAGFDRRGETKLMFSYIASAYEKLSEPEPAREYYLKKLALLSDGTLPESDVARSTEEAVVLNRVGVLSHRLGMKREALAYMRRSLALTRDLGLTFGTVVNVHNMSRICSEFVSEGQSVDWESVELILSVLDELDQEEIGGKRAVHLYTSTAFLLATVPPPALPKSVSLENSAKAYHAWASARSQALTYYKKAEALLGGGDVVPMEEAEPQLLLVKLNMMELTTQAGKVEASRSLQAELNDMAGDHDSQHAWLVYLTQAVRSENVQDKDRLLEKAFTTLMALPPQVYPRQDALVADGLYEALAIQYTDRLLARGDYGQAFVVVEQIEMRAIAARLYHELGTDFFLRGLGEYKGELDGLLREMRQALTEGDRQALAVLREELQEILFAVYEEYPWAVAYFSQYEPTETVLAEILSPTQPYVKIVRGADREHLFVHDGTAVTYAALGGVRGEFKEASDVSERLREAASLYLSAPAGSRESLAGLSLEGRNVTRVQTIYDAVNGYGRRSLFSNRVAVAGALDIPRSDVGRAVPLSVDVVSGQSADDQTILSQHDVLVAVGDPEHWSFTVHEELGVRDMIRIEDLASGTKHTAFLLSFDQEHDRDADLVISGLIRAGYPHVIVHEGPYDEAVAQRLVSSYLSLLSTRRPDEALASASRTVFGEDRGPSTFVLYGFAGMDQEEKAAYAADLYSEQVDRAVMLYQDQRYGEAIKPIENALSVIGYTDNQQDYVQLTKLAVDAAFKVGDYKKAVFYQTQLLAYVERAEDEEELPEASYRLGVLYSRLEQWEPAIEHLQTALKLWEETEELDRLAEGVATLGVVRENMGSYSKALTAFGRSFELFEEIGEVRDVAAQYRRIGRIHYLRLGRYEEARSNFSAALNLYRELEDRGAEAEALFEIGLTYEKVGLFDEADANYRAGRAIGEELREPFLIASGDLYLANTAWFRGNYHEAFQYLSQASRGAEQAGDPQLRIMVSNTRGLIYWTLNEIDKGLVHLNRALALAEQEDIKTEVASSLNNLGLIYRERGDLDRSLELFRRASEIDQELNSKWGLGYDYRNIGISLLRKKQYAAAEVSFEKAERASAEIKNINNWVKALLELGNVSRLTGRQDQALQYYDRAYEVSARYGIKEVLWRAAAGRAAVLRAGGKRGEALEWYARAVDVVEGMRASLKIDEFRNSFQANKQDLYKEIIGLLVEMGRTEEAFNYLERSHSRSFIDLLGNQKLALKTEIDQQQLERINSLSKRVEALATEIASFEQPPPELAERYRETKALYKEALLELKQSNPALSSFVAVNPLTQREVQQMLEPGIALLAYKLMRDRSYVWVLKSGSVSFAEIPAGEKELEALVKQYRGLVQRLEPVDEELLALSGLLIRPVERELTGVAYLGIIPDGALHFLSFAALKEQEAYLVERVPLFYAPSASVLRYTFAKRGAGKQTKVLAVGNPDLGNYNYDLPLAELEARSIRWSFPEMDILTGSKATKEWFVRHISDYGIIHLAAHGEFDEFNPLLSSLWLASAEPANRRLTVKEVFSLDLKADLVTLSACQTGLGKLKAGELIGLNRAFIYAGTHALISALWRVDDLSTSVLMKHFYRSYVTEDKANSLRQAQLMVKKDFPHPAYWAGMSLVGDYR